MSNYWKITSMGKVVKSNRAPTNARAIATIKTKKGKIRIYTSITKKGKLSKR